MTQPLSSRQSGPLKGIVTPPGDKSISHRAIMLGGIAKGTTKVTGLLEGEDVLRTVAALRELGAKITKVNDIWHIEGVGLDGLKAPKKPLDMGNSGTAARLLMGLLCGKQFVSSFTGDASLCKRPMGRVIKPLEMSGATITSTNGRMPLLVKGAIQPKKINYRLPVASAQVKSAILLAGLGAEGVTTVIETLPTRDHSENMLRSFGAEVLITRQADGADAISITGKPNLVGRDVFVPGDPSSAAFPMVAALLRPDSEVTLLNVGLNPRRNGLVETLLEMGASIALANRKETGDEPVADLTVKGSTLKAVTVPATRSPSMIDEYPILAVAASFANGTTRMCGLGELRVKESDRLAIVADGLKSCGVKVEIEGDDLIVHGDGNPPAGGGDIVTAMDHRIAMSFLVMGCATVKPVYIDDGSFIATSFPGFVELMNGLGTKIQGS